MGVIKIIGTPLYQWELGRKISISTSEHTIINKVEFSHDGDTESLVVKPRVENDQMVVDIPNIMLLSGRYIHVYISYSDENLLETVAYDILPVIKRPKPSDYVYTETEVLTWESLDERIKKLEKSTGGADISKEDIQDAVNEYLDNNPVSVNETDPTVPDWAKQPNPPKQPDALPNPHKLTFSGAVSAEYDGSKEVIVNIPEGGSGGNADYELPIANPETLGGVKPVAKGADMTQKVGVDELGGLWTAPGGGGDEWNYEYLFEASEDVASVEFDFVDSDGNPVSLRRIEVVQHLLSTNESGADTSLKVLCENGAIIYASVANNYANKGGNWLSAVALAEIIGKTVYALGNKAIDSSASYSGGFTKQGVVFPVNAWGDRWASSLARPVAIIGIKVPGAIGAKSQLYICGVRA